MRRLAGCFDLSTSSSTQLSALTEVLGCRQFLFALRSELTVGSRVLPSCRYLRILFKHLEGDLAATNESGGAGTGGHFEVEVE
jgi:hypothetical protein